mgnify:CR=1 FL=1
MKIQYDIEARRQIGEIFKYGKVKFGTQIALKYKEKLREKINTLKQNPLIGNNWVDADWWRAWIQISFSETLQDNILRKGRYYKNSSFLAYSP